jgi:hypothetical protein
MVAFPPRRDAKLRLPDWPRPLIPIGRDFSSKRRQLSIFERSNPVVAYGRGALRRASEYLSISTFAPAPEIHSLRGGFLPRGRQFPFSSGRVRCYNPRAVHADHRVQPCASPLDVPHRAGFRCPRQQGSVLPLIETKGVPIGIWTRDAGTRVPRSTKRRLFRSVDRARAVGYGTSPSTELRLKFPIPPIFQIGFS